MENSQEKKAHPLRAGAAFLGKAVLFLLPLLILGALPIWTAYRSGELMPNDDIVKAMMSAPTSSPILVGLAMSDPSVYIDFRFVEMRDPEVLVIGDSRVGGFRANFFTKANGVYIAAGAAQKIAQVTDFLRRLPPGEGPKLLVIGLNQKFFDPGYVPLIPDSIANALLQPVSASDVLSNWPMFYWYFYKREFSIGQIMDHPANRIGLTAIVHGAGYRSDGGYDPGDRPYDPHDPNFAYLEQGGFGFEYASSVSPAALGELNDLLALCKSRGIGVVAFLPPYSPKAYAALAAKPASEEGYLSLIMPSAEPIFQKYGDRIFDFTDPAKLGITQSEMEDSVHATERASLMYFAAMAQADPLLQHYTDVATLNAGLASSTADFGILGK